MIIAFRKISLICMFLLFDYHSAGAEERLKFDKKTGFAEGVENGKEYRYGFFNLNTVNEYGEMYFFLKNLRKNYTPMVFDGDKEPLRIPTFEESSKTVFGIDSDNDGVRDEFEIFTNRTIKEKNARIAIKKMAKTINKIFNMRLEKDEFSKVDFKKIGKIYSDEYYPSVDCYEINLNRKQKMHGEYYDLLDFIDKNYLDTIRRKKISYNIEINMNISRAKSPDSELRELTKKNKKKCN